MITAGRKVYVRGVENSVSITGIHQVHAKFVINPVDMNMKSVKLQMMLNIINLYAEFAAILKKRNISFQKLAA